jgi:hypothetical protein
MDALRYLANGITEPVIDIGKVYAGWAT